MNHQGDERLGFAQLEEWDNRDKQIDKEEIQLYFGKGFNI